LSIQDYEAFYRRSIEDREGFWAQQARMIDWKRGWDEVLDYSNPPFARWYVGAETNLCHNAVDRHLEERADQEALVYLQLRRGATRSRRLGLGYGPWRVLARQPSPRDVSRSQSRCCPLRR
jgi:hypothetical protein